ncbi:RNA-directed DNA polymerase, eukaryota [Tanacetum coccineum]
MSTTREVRIKKNFHNDLHGDLTLPSALNTNYLLTLPVYVDWKKASEYKAIFSEGDMQWRGIMAFERSIEGQDVELGTVELFGTKIFINSDIHVLVEFRKSYESREDYVADKFKIELLAPEVRVVSPIEFMQGASKKMVANIREIEPVHSIHYESGWAYTGCKVCSRRVHVVDPNAPVSSKKRNKSVCIEHGETLLLGVSDKRISDGVFLIGVGLTTFFISKNCQRKTHKHSSATSITLTLRTLLEDWTKDEKNHCLDETEKSLKLVIEPSTLLMGTCYWNIVDGTQHDQPSVFTTDTHVFFATNTLSETLLQWVALEYLNLLYLLDCALIKHHKVVSLTPTDSKITNNGISNSIQKLRCRIKYRALKYFAPIEELGKTLVARMRQNGGPYLALHLRIASTLGEIGGYRVHHSHHLLSNDDDQQVNVAPENNGDKENINSSDVDRVSESSFSHVNDVVFDNPLIINAGFKPPSTADRRVSSDSFTGVNEHTHSSSPKTNKMNSIGKVSPVISMKGGSILDMNFLSLNVQGLGKKSKKDWIRELCIKHRVNFLSIQETKMESIDLFSIKAIWGNLNFDYVMSPSVGFSGGIVCVWDPSLFSKHHVSKSDYFVAIMGTWTPSSTKLLLISVYAPQELSEKRALWNYLRNLIDRWDGDTIIMGDFNEVRYDHERFGSSFNTQGAKAFNHFISQAGLVDIPLEGYSFTWAHKSASKMSKLDRFLISDGLLVMFPHLSALCLDRHLSDHRPILLKESSHDFGPIPFRLFHSCLKRKLQSLKSAIKEWSKEARLCYNENKLITLNKLSETDKLIDQGKCTNDILSTRNNLLKDLHDLYSLEAADISQKAKIRWSIEGDENTKYFHEDLECPVSYDEVKSAVWGCGTNKSPGPDGFTFEFYRVFWALIDRDVFNAVSEFFESGCIPKGCNASFIALIPKIHDAKIVKDFRPISLIGSIYKIITKILANRLCFVLPSLISDVQSAFVSNRNILDGPFMLNELLSWCKHKKRNAFIFKVDFEKAFDTVKWDFLLDTLQAFGFGQKWCNWINGCLQSATGSVLVNGSPSSEFQFFRGLKQGDPISPFLFILIMESLHLSFSRVINEGLFKGIAINPSFSISHLFYADDAVFVGEWNDSNIKTVVKVLKCFFLASGLKINLLKSKLMGVGVNPNEVSRVATSIGCSTFTAPFKYLGVSVGDNMSRIASWDDIIFKVSNRLSKWKLKTLSIGGRLTLLKSVLSSIPLYHMSIFKAPIGVLNKLEAIRRNFFNGVDGSENKIAWIVHGNHGAFGYRMVSSKGSPWLDIIRDLSTLKSKGIDLMNFMRKKIGNGHNTSFWNDPWLDGEILKSSFHRAFTLETCKSISVASKLNHPSLTHSFRRLPRGGVEEDQVSLLSQRINDVVLSDSNDRWTWNLEGSGLFSVKSARRVIDESLLPSAGVPTRWIKITPTKVNILAWRVCLNKIPTRFNLLIKGIDIPTILCPFCNAAAESTSHIFFSCLLARQIRSKVLRWWKLDDIPLDSNHMDSEGLPMLHVNLLTISMRLHVNLLTISMRSEVITRIPENQLGDEGLSSRGTKLISIFITAEVQKTSSRKQNLSANRKGKHKSINGKEPGQAKRIWLGTIIGMIRGNTSKKRPHEQLEHWSSNEISFPSMPRSKLIEILRKHADAFTWTLANMIEIPRFITEHELKTYPHIELRVQRKQSIAPDRRKVIKDKVAEWLKAEIVRKVRYPTWVANPVLVKKLDNSLEDVH